jgi:hypothetical protein
MRVTIYKKTEAGKTKVATLALVGGKIVVDPPGAVPHLLGKDAKRHLGLDPAYPEDYLRQLPDILCGPAQWAELEEA